jgi:hypothetical protein
MLALLVPMAVWKGEGPDRRGYHHSMPVQRGAHAITKSLAGLAWLLAGVGAYFGWLALMAVFTRGTIEPVAAWRWATPFAGATVLYLLGSALTLRVAHAWRWLGGAFVAYLFLGALQVADGAGALYRLINTVLFGHLGISTVVTGYVQEAGPESWHLHTSPALWLGATWLWLALAVALFVWAAYRQPER